MKLRAAPSPRRPSISYNAGENGMFRGISEPGEIPAPAPEGNMFVALPLMDMMEASVSNSLPRGDDAMMSNPMFQSLESRTMLSTHVGGVWSDPKIVADREAIMADYKDLRADK